MKPLNGAHLSFPFRAGSGGRMATVSTLDQHVRDELVQLLLTSQGERPFLVDFGGGVRRLVFEPADGATAAMAKARITQAIDRWLGHRVQLEYMNLRVDSANALIEVDIRYRLAGTTDTRVLRFQREGG